MKTKSAQNKEKKMKRRIALLIAFALGLMASVPALSVNAQNQDRFTLDSGFIPLGPNQIVRVGFTADIRT